MDFFLFPFWSLCQCAVTLSNLQAFSAQFNLVGSSCSDIPFFYCSVIWCQIKLCQHLCIASPYFHGAVVTSIVFHGLPCCQQYSYFRLWLHIHFMGVLSLEFGSPERVDKYFKVNINIQVSLPYPHSEHSQVFCLKYQCWAFIHQKSIFQIWCFYLWSWIIGTFLIFIEWEFISLMRTCFIY